MTKNQIIGRVNRLKKTESKRALLAKCIKEMHEDISAMQNLRQFPNPVYKDKPVTYDRTDQLYLDICDLNLLFDSFMPRVVSNPENVMSDNLPF